MPRSYLFLLGALSLSTMTLLRTGVGARPAFAPRALPGQPPIPVPIRIVDRSPETCVSPGPGLCALLAGVETASRVSTATIERLTYQELRARLAHAETAREVSTATIEKLTEQVDAALEINQAYKGWLENYAPDMSTTGKLCKWTSISGTRHNLELTTGGSEAHELAIELAAADLVIAQLERELDDATFSLERYRERLGDVTNATGVVGQ